MVSFRIAGTLVVASLLSAPIAAQSFPDRPIRLVVPYPAGGTTDILSRLMANSLREEFGQPVVVENKAGAATALAAQDVARAPADGHTLLMATVTTMSLNPLLVPRLQYQANQLAPVAMVAKHPFVLVAHPEFPPNTVAELIAYAKASPGKVNLATQGSGGSSHMVAEMFKAASGADITLVHYKGSAPAIADTIAGHVQLHFDGITTSLPHIGNKRLKAIGVTSDSRVPAAPQLPTFVEQGQPRVVAYAWYGLVAPAGTPEPVVQRLNTAVNKALQTKAFKDRLSQDALEPGVGSPADFARSIAEETETWRKIIAPLNLKLD